MSMKTWSRFSKLKNGTEIKFKIQEVSIREYAEIFELYAKYFSREEPFVVASGISANATALADYEENMDKYMRSIDHQVDACYVDDGSNKLVAASTMYLSRRNIDPPPDQHKFDIKTTELENYLSLTEALDSAYNVLEQHNLDSYFVGQGMVVDPEYRGLGIAGELLKARMEACKEYKVPATGAWMTAFGTQKAAARLGWENVKVLNYAELGKKAGVSFPSGPLTGKLMLARVPV